MSYEIVKRAKEIIFSMEGHYSSVNADDNGAVSVGCVQWHGNRAKALLKTIVLKDKETAVHLLARYLVDEILSSASWSKRTVDGIEKLTISMLLNTSAGRTSQDKLAEKDIQNYINHIVKLGVEEEEAIIFMADIENQGGAGASKRIINNSKEKTLESLYETALIDKVFKRYADRRKIVFKKLTGKEYQKKDSSTLGYYTVKKGENLTIISRRLGTTIQAIVRDNNIKDPDLIFIGQRLKIVKGGE